MSPPAEYGRPSEYDSSPEPYRYVSDSGGFDINPRAFDFVRATEDDDVREDTPDPEDPLHLDDTASAPPSAKPELPDGYGAAPEPTPPGLEVIAVPEEVPTGSGQEVHLIESVAPAQSARIGESDLGPPVQGRVADVSAVSPSLEGSEPSEHDQPPQNRGLGGGVYKVFDGVDDDADMFGPDPWDAIVPDMPAGVQDCVPMVEGTVVKGWTESQTHRDLDLPEPGETGPHDNASFPEIDTAAYASVEERTGEFDQSGEDRLRMLDPDQGTWRTAETDPEPPQAALEEVLAVDDNHSLADTDQQSALAASKPSPEDAEESETVFESEETAPDTGDAEPGVGDEDQDEIDAEPEPEANTELKADREPADGPGPAAPRADKRETVTITRRAGWRAADEPAYATKCPQLPDRSRMKPVKQFQQIIQRFSVLFLSAHITPNVLSPEALGAQALGFAAAEKPFSKFVGFLVEVSVTGCTSNPFAGKGAGILAETFVDLLIQNDLAVSVDRRRSALSQAALMATAVVDVLQGNLKDSMAVRQLGELYGMEPVDRTLQQGVKVMAPYVNDEVRMSPRPGARLHNTRTPHQFAHQFHDEIEHDLKESSLFTALERYLRTERLHAQRARARREQP